MTAQLRPVADHLAAILEMVTPLPVTDVPLLEARGLRLAVDVTAAVALPPFDNSAMDGYAVCAADLSGAGDEHPVRLPVVGESAAGVAGAARVTPGVAMKVMTGAPVPAGADAVVPYEWTDRGVDTVTITRAPEVGRHIRPRADDVAVGDVVLTAGTVLGARHLGVAAAVGLSALPVWRRPRVAVLATGAELQAAGTTLRDDGIYDSNSWMLTALLASAGAEVQRIQPVTDDPEAFVAALRGAEADVVVTSGGISQGDHDVVKAALRDEPGFWFGGVAMQPGKPQGFGRLGDARAGGPLVYTVPGNPVSAYVSTLAFVLPALAAMTGGQGVWPLRDAALGAGLSSPPGKQQFVRGVWDEHGRVRPIGHASHMVGSLAEAQLLIVVPTEVTALAEGDDVQIWELADR